MRKCLETAIIFAIIIGWWGFLYPELSMVTEGCTREAETGTVDEEAQTTDERQLWKEEAQTTGERQLQKEEAQTTDERQFREETAPLTKIGEELGSTGIVSGNFRIKSRIAEYLYQGKEKDKMEKESDYEQQKRAHRGV